MHINILAFAVPLFIGLILLEYFISKKKGLPYFNLNNSIANISIGIAERLSDVLVTGAFYFVYDYVQKHYGIFKIHNGVLLWLLLLICTDFIWYWYHRLAHEVSVLWAVHVVHHQSEDYNFTVSARITVLQAFVRSGFWVILPLIGFPAAMITGMLLIHGIYPFFIHTRLIGKLGVLEYFLVTPSHHRVHHSCNEKYLDKNYGDVFIIWDKLFGTFQKEDEEPVYGLTHPLKTYSFLWQHFHFFIELVLAAKSKNTLREKVAVFFQKPEKIDAAVRNKAEQIFNIKQSKATLNSELNNYVIWQMIVMLISLFAFILFEQQLNPYAKLIFAVLTILTLINCGAIMEQKRWIFYIEIIRVAVTIPFVLLLVPAAVQYALMVMLLLTVFVLITVSYFTSLQKFYLKIVYKNNSHKSHY
ncbi:MAG: sterol desaturase [Chitinophaga sp.]|jgi:alkylglycerol monooxygenase|nr:sterol desaturase [Chitinophaga sp.]